MSGYWITFRIADDAGWTRRYNALIEALRSVSVNQWWDEPTSFLLFQSNFGIDHIANRVSIALNRTTDTALIGMTEFKDSRLIGFSDQHDAVFRMMPYTKYA